VREFQSNLEAYLKGSWKYATRSFQRGELLIKEGADGDSAFVILNGECEIFTINENDQEIFRSKIGPGQTFGELSIFTNEPRSASIRALTEVLVKVIDRSSFEAWLDIDPVTSKFVHVLAQRFKSHEDKLKRAKQYKRTNERITPMIIELSRRIGDRGQVSLDELRNLAHEKGVAEDELLEIVQSHRQFHIKGKVISFLSAQEL
jgi:CRP-like cAMP-binding protein